MEAGEERVASLPPELQSAARQRLVELQGTIVSAVNQGDVGYDVTTRGWLGWSGFQADLGFGDLELGAVGLIGFGAIDAVIGPNAQLEASVRTALDRFPRLADAVLERERSEQALALLSYYLGLDARYALTTDLAIELFGIAMSGDNGIPSPLADPSPGRAYHSFVSIAPLIPKTDIFFGAGVAHNLSTPTIASLAPDGAGLLAGGIDVEWFILKNLRLHALVAAMASSVTRDAYGVELDASLDAFLLDWLIASADGGLFIPGQHFGDVPIGYQTVVALRVLFAD